eukprot:UN07933
MLDKSSSVGGDEENDDIGPLHPNSQKQTYRQQIQYGQQLSPIINTMSVNSKRISQSEMSDSQSRRTGKSFITLVEEQKQIEISNM